MRSKLILLCLLILQWGKFPVYFWPTFPNFGVGNEATLVSQVQFNSVPVSEEVCVCDQLVCVPRRRLFIVLLSLSPSAQFTISATLRQKHSICESYMTKLPSPIESILEKHIKYFNISKKIKVHNLINLAT